MRSPDDDLPFKVTEKDNQKLAFLADARLTFVRMYLYIYTHAFIYISIYIHIYIYLHTQLMIVNLSSAIPHFFGLGWPFH